MFNKYDAYKDSCVGLIGQIPENWSLKKLKFLTQVNASSLPENHPKTEIISYVDIGNVSFEKGISEVQQLKFSEAPSRARRLANCGDTVVSTVRTYLKAITYVDERCSNYVYSTGFAVLSPNEELIPKFLLNFVKSNSFTHQVDVVAKGMSYPAINSTELSNLWVSFPDIETQEKIVEFLDQKTSEIDQAIAIKEQQIALLNERKQIVIQKAVTQGLDPNVPMKDSCLNGVGSIPQDWEIVKFKYLAKVRYGLGQPPRQLDNGLKIIRATNVDRGRIVEKGMLYIDPNDIPWDRNPTLNKDEIIVVRSGAYAGDSAIVTDEYAGCIAGYDMVATPFNCYPKFLSTVLLSHYVLYEQIYLLRMRSAQPHLNAEELNELKIVVPPINQQRLIANYIEKVESDIGEAISLIKQQLEKLKEYKTILINDAVTGKIKVA